MSEQLHDIYIWVQIDRRGDETGFQSINVAFEDDPSRIHSGVYHEDYSREDIVQMLRDLALRIEHNVSGEPH